MKLNVDNKEFMVDFEYDGNVTKCYVIFSIRPEMPAIGYAYRNPKDRFEKEKARKLALKRALGGLPKEMRTKFWTEFHRLRGKTHYLKHAGVAV